MLGAYEVGAMLTIIDFMILSSLMPVSSPRLMWFRNEVAWLRKRQLHKDIVFNLNIFMCMCVCVIISENVWKHKGKIHHNPLIQ